MDKPNIDSSIYHISQGALLGHLFKLHGRPWVIGIGVVILILAIIALIFSDVRFGILALMILFLVIPMVMSMLYFNYALKYDVSFNALPHSLHLSDKGVEVKIYNYKSIVEQEDGQDGNYSSEQSAEGADHSQANEYVQTGGIDYPFNRFSRYDVGLKGVYYRILGVDKSGKKRGKHKQPVPSLKEEGFLYIPASAFNTASDYNDFIMTISEKIRK